MANPNIYANLKPIDLPDPQAILTGMVNQQAIIQKAKDDAQKAKDADAVRQALSTAGGDKDVAIQKLRQIGAFGAADAIQKADTEQRAAKAKLVTDQLMNQQKRNSTLSGYIEAARSDPNDDAIQTLMRQIQSVPLDSDDTPEDQAALLQQLQTLPADKRPALLSQWSRSLLTEVDQDKQNEAHLKLLLGNDPIRGAAGLLAQTKDPQDAAEEYQAILAMSHNPEHRAALKATLPDPRTLTPETFAAFKTDMANRARSQKEKDELVNTEADNARADKSETRQAESDAARIALERQRVGLEARRVGLSEREAALNQAAGGAVGDRSGKTGDELLNTLPATTADLVKALAEGRKSFPTGAALRSPYWTNLLGLVAQYDPGFDESNYLTRSKVRSDFTSGKSAQQINALNTVVGHLSTLRDQAGGLGNTRAQWVNTVKNWVKTQAGSSAVTNFDTAKEAVASELVRVWRQAGGAEADIQAWKARMDSSNSPEQANGAFRIIGDLLESKLSSMEEQYRQGLGTKASDLRIITPEARASLDKLEGKSGQPAATGKITVVDPNGGSHVFDTQAQADEFKRRAGIK